MTMQTRPFFKNLASKISKAFFRHPDQHQPTVKPDFKPEVQQNKSSGGSGRRGRGYYLARHRKMRQALISAPPSTNPKFMSRAARIRAGLQEWMPTWKQLQIVKALPTAMQQIVYLQLCKKSLFYA